MIVKTCCDCGEQFEASPFPSIAKSMKRCPGCRGKSHLITVYCAQCGTEKKVKPSEWKSNKHKRFFCGFGCKGAWLAANNVGANNCNFKTGKVEVQCAVCGKPKLVHPARFRYTEHFVCSEACKGVFNANRYMGAKSPNWKGGLVETTCAQCGQAIMKTQAAMRLYPNHFCSQKCHGAWKKAHQVGEAAANWRGGLSFEPYPTVWNHRLREMIRDRDGRRCRVCGKSEEENGSKLCVHHVDYNKANCSPENLASTCHDCHSKTNFNRDEWSAFFRRQMNGSVQAACAD